MAHCDYWWFAGGVEWCDLLSGSCKCGGWEESCGLKRRRRKAGRNNHMQMRTEGRERLRYARHSQSPR